MILSVKYYIQYHSTIIIVHMIRLKTKICIKDKDL